MPFTPVIRIPTFLSFYAFSRLFRQLLAFLSSTPVIRFPAFSTRHSFSRLSRPLFVTRNLWRFRQAFSSPITISSSLSRAFDQRFLSLFLIADPFPVLFANDLFSLVFLPFTVACLLRWISPLQSFCLTSPLTRLLTLNFSPFSPRHAWQSIAMSHPKPISKLNTHSMKNKCRVFLLLNDLQLQLSY